MLNVRVVNRSGIDLRTLLFDIDLPPFDPALSTVFFDLIPVRNPPPIKEFPGLSTTLLVLPVDQWEYPDEPLFYHFKVGTFAASKLLKFIEDLFRNGLSAKPQFFL